MKIRNGSGRNLTEEKGISNRTLAVLLGLAIVVSFVGLIVGRSSITGYQVAQNNDTSGGNITLIILAEVDIQGLDSRINFSSIVGGQQRNSSDNFSFYDPDDPGNYSAIIQGANNATGGSNATGQNATDNCFGVNFSNSPVEAAGGRITCVSDDHDVLNNGTSNIKLSLHGNNPLFNLSRVGGVVNSTNKSDATWQFYLINFRNGTGRAAAEFYNQTARNVTINIVNRTVFAEGMAPGAVASVGFVVYPAANETSGGKNASVTYIATEDTDFSG